LGNASASSARTETIGGREYVVASATLIVPGILSGSKGPLLYPKEELSASIWNNVPLTVGHPVKDGVHVSARTPGVQHIGFTRNAVVGDKLEAEACFDIQATNNADPRIIPWVKAGKKIQLSTGLFTSNEEKPGLHQGREYIAVARNHRADHVAILPDEVGACSINDGCGVNNADAKSTLWRRFGEMLGIFNADQPRHPKDGTYQGKPHNAAKAGHSDTGYEGDPDCTAYNERWSQGERDKLPVEDFAGPDQSFPIRTQKDVDSAAKLAGHADNPAEVRKKIASIAKRKGLTLPDSWTENVSMQDCDYASKEAAKATLDTDHAKARKHALEAVDTESSSEAADAHEKAARAHEKAATEARKNENDDAAMQHDRAAALHRRAASMHASTNNTLGDTAVNKSEMVEYLAANCACWKGDEKTLNTFGEKKLKALVDGEKERAKLQVVANAAMKGVKVGGKNYAYSLVTNKFVHNAEEDDEDEEDSEMDEEEKGKKGKPVKNTAEEWFKDAPPDVQSVVRNALKVQEREKARIADALVANVQDADARKRKHAFLMNKKLEELVELHELLPAAQQHGAAEPLPLFIGNAGATPSTSKQPTANRKNVLPLPRIDYAALAKEQAS